MQKLNSIYIIQEFLLTFLVFKSSLTKKNLPTSYKIREIIIIIIFLKDIHFINKCDKTQKLEMK